MQRGADPGGGDPGKTRWQPTRTCLRRRWRPDFGSEHSPCAFGRSHFTWMLPYTPLEMVAMLFRRCAGDSSSWHCEIRPRAPAAGWESPWMQWRRAAHPGAWQVEVLPGSEPAFFQLGILSHPAWCCLQLEFTQVRKLG